MSRIVMVSFIVPYEMQIIKNLRKILISIILSPINYFIIYISNFLSMADKFIIYMQLYVTDYKFYSILFSFYKNPTRNIYLNHINQLQTRSHLCTILLKAKKKINENGDYVHHVSILVQQLKNNPFLWNMEIITSIFR